jgi:hypothetical protein
MLAVFAGRLPGLVAKFAGEMALIGKATLQGHHGQGLVGVDQCTGSHPHSEPPDVLLGRNMKAVLELPLERPDGHVRDRSELGVADLLVVMIANVGDDRLETLRTDQFAPVRTELPRGAGGTDDASGSVLDGNLVRDTPGSGLPGLAHALDPVYHAVTVEDSLVVEPILIREECGREIVIRLADDLGGIAQGVVEQESAIDMTIAALAILDPELDVLQRFEKRRELKGGCHPSFHSRGRSDQYGLLGAICHALTCLSFASPPAAKTDTPRLSGRTG